jgi:hypothetical protein
LGDDNILGLRIETDDADVQVVIVEAKADFGFFRSGRSFVGFLLDETAGRFNLLPDWFSDESVQHGRRFDALRAQPFPR